MPLSGHHDVALFEWRRQGNWIDSKIKHFVKISSVNGESACNLIYRIPGLCLLISSLASSALRMHVESLHKPWDFNKRKAFPGKLDIRIQPTGCWRQQRELVAGTIRGSVPFYLSAVWRPDFFEIAQFRCQNGVDSIKVRTLFYCWKLAMIIINIVKIQKVKLNRKDASFVDINLLYIFSHKTEGFVWSPGAGRLLIALWSKPLCNSYNVTSQSDNSCAKRQLPHALSRLWKR